MNAKNQISRLRKDTRGANMVEYIILVGLIALAGIAGFRAFGSNVTQKIQAQGQQVQGVQ
jgi:pilus assembly protein Flp/PilA